MLRVSVVMFLAGMLSLSFGIYGIADVSFELGRLLMLVFISLATISLIASVALRNS